MVRKPDMVVQNRMEGCEDCKDGKKRITSSIYNSSRMWMCAAFAALHVQDGQVQGQNRHWDDVNIQGVYGVTTTFTVKQSQLLHIGCRLEPLGQCGRRGRYY